MSTLKKLDKLKNQYIEVIFSAKSPNFKTKTNWSDYNIDHEKSQLISKTQTPGTKSTLFSDAKLCPWATRPYNIAQKARNILFFEKYGITKIPISNKKYIYLIPKDNAFNDIKIQNTVYKSLYDVFTDLRDEFWEAVNDIIKNYNTITRLTLINRLSTFYAMHKNCSINDAVKRASIDVHKYINNTLNDTKTKKIIHNISDVIPDIKIFQHDYNSYRAQKKYEELSFELQMIKNSDDTKYNELKNNITTQLNNKNIFKYKSEEFHKILFDFQFFFTEINIPQINIEEKKLQNTQKYLEQQLKKKQIDEARLRREMLAEFDARIKLTNTITNSLLETYQQSLNNFNNLIKNEMSKLIKKLTKNNNKATITNKTFNKIKNFCSEVKRAGVLLNNSEIDKFVNELLSISETCITGQNNEDELIKFIEQTIQDIEKDNSRFIKKTRSEITNTEKTLTTSEKNIFKHDLKYIR